MAMYESMGALFVENILNVEDFRKQMSSRKEYRRLFERVLNAYRGPLKDFLIEDDLDTRIAYCDLYQIDY